MFNDKIICTLGSGAFAGTKVVLVELKNEEINVAAIKMFDRQSDLVRSRSKAIFQEKLVMERLSENYDDKNINSFSKYIIKLYNKLKDDTMLYLIMEAALGGPLHKHLQQASTIDIFDVDTIIKYSAEIITGLNYLALKGCIHRDLKLSNCFLDRYGHIQIGDFGCSRILYDSGAWISVKAGGSERAPRGYTIIGTPHMMAPECFTKNGHSLGCDWWSLGALIYEMLTKKPAFSNLYNVSINDAINLTNIEEEKEEDKEELNKIFELNFDVSFNNAFDNKLNQSGYSTKTTLIPKVDMQNLIEGLMNKCETSRYNPWNLDKLKSHNVFKILNINWEAIENGTALSPRNDFDKRLGALEIVEEREMKNDQNEEKLTDEQQALFQSF